MAPLAEVLCSRFGILEALQTATTVRGQVIELKAILENHGNIPGVLIGHSWGAWLAYLTAADHPSLVKKLILVASGPFLDRDAKGIMETRLRRLNKGNRTRLLELQQILAGGDVPLRDQLFKEFGELISKADAYDALPLPDESIPCRFDMFRSVWNEAARMRSTGKLLDIGKRIQCPVIAIHGDHDPHPAEGVRQPLSTVIRNFRFLLLKNCGHDPWKERHARGPFFDALEKELIRTPHN